MPRRQLMADNGNGIVKKEILAQKSLFQWQTLGPMRP